MLLDEAPIDFSLSPESSKIIDGLVSAIIMLGKTDSEDTTFFHLKEGQE